jgi:hypothetical protein
MKWDNETFLEPTVKAETIPAPDFDNETTLLSARPVVPLAAAGVRSSSRLLHSASAVALLLVATAIGALIQIGRGEFPVAMDTVSESENPPPASTGRLAAGTSAEVPSTALEQRLKQSEPEGPASKETNQSPINRRSARTQQVVKSYAGGRVDRMPSPGRGEARRLRREAERVTERNQGSVDGIFKIEDIFEGSRRP